MALVKLYGNLRYPVGSAALQIHGGTVRDVLKMLCADHPSLRAAMFEGDTLHPYVRIMLNGHDIEFLNGLETSVDENDQLAIFPPIAGGGA